MNILPVSAGVPGDSLFPDAIFKPATIVYINTFKNLTVYVTNAHKSKLHLARSGGCISVLRITGSRLGLLYKQCRH